MACHMEGKCSYTTTSNHNTYFQVTSLNNSVDLSLYIQSYFCKKQEVISVHNFKIV